MQLDRIKLSFTRIARDYRLRQTKQSPVNLGRLTMHLSISFWICVHCKKDISNVMLPSDLHNRFCALYFWQLTNFCMTNYPFKDRMKSMQLFQTIAYLENYMQSSNFCIRRSFLFNIRKGLTMSICAWTFLTAQAYGQESSDAAEVQRCEAEKRLPSNPYPSLASISCQEMVEKSKSRRTRVIKIVRANSVTPNVSAPSESSEELKQ